MLRPYLFAAIDITLTFTRSLRLSTSEGFCIRAVVTFETCTIPDNQRDRILQLTFGSSLHPIEAHKGTKVSKVLHHAVVDFI